MTESFLALAWFRAANQGPFRRTVFERLAHGFDYFAHDAGKSLLVEAALGHETVARWRAPPAWNFRHINVEPQGEMGERMGDTLIELPVGRFNRRLACHRGRV